MLDANVVTKLVSGLFDREASWARLTSSSRICMTQTCVSHNPSRRRARQAILVTSRNPLGPLASVGKRRDEAREELAMPTSIRKPSDIAGGYATGAASHA